VVRPPGEAADWAAGITVGRLDRVKAEHPGWEIRPTPGARVIGYTAIRRDADVLRTSTLSELEDMLRQADGSASSSQ
jgi:hypothetical protein